MVLIYDEQTLRRKLQDMMAHHENEVVEFKEAKTTYNFNDIGKYFSALSNEATSAENQKGG